MLIYEIMNEGVPECSFSHGMYYPLSFAKEKLEELARELQKNDPLYGIDYSLKIRERQLTVKEGAKVFSVKTTSLKDLECLAIKRALTHADFNLTEASKMLGIGRATLYRKMKEYDIKADR